MVDSIRLQQFRSYTDAVFEFGSGVNILVGPNGSGKTNLLEAILVVAQGSSYRVGDGELLQLTTQWARLDVTLDSTIKRTIKLQAGNPFRKTYDLDGKSYSRLPAIKKVPVVLFEPNHLAILSGPPEGRRNYIDGILEQTQPGFSGFRKNYKRVLAQRNALLKHPFAKQQDFFPWNLRLSELGAVIHRARLELVATLTDEIGGLYQDLSHSTTVVSLMYEGRFPADSYESCLLEALEAYIDKDIERGFTGFGPHREDIRVEMDHSSAILVASRGESRTVTLALKILELITLQEATRREPLLLLDDVFSELDGSRRRALTSYLQRYQTFITTTEADTVVKHFTNSTIIPLPVD